MQRNPKINFSSSSPEVDRLILRKSIAGIEFILDHEVSKDEDVGYAAKMSKTMCNLADSLAFKLKHIITNDSKLSLQEKTSCVRNDPKLWKEFLKELNDLKIVTNFGVKEVLIKFIAERENEIVALYGDSVKTSAHPPVMSKEDKAPNEVIGNVIQRAVTSSSALSSMAAAASSVKRNIQKRTSMSFELKRPPSDQHQNSSDSTRRHTDMRHNVAFDFSNSAPESAYQVASNSTLSGMTAATSSVKRSILRRTFMPLNFNSKHFSSEHHYGSSDATKHISEMPRKVTFDTSNLSSKTAEQASSKLPRMSVDDFRRNVSFSAQTSFNAIPRYSEIQSNTQTENSSSQDNTDWSSNEEHSTQKYRGNIAKMNLIKRMTTSDISLTNVTCGEKKHYSDPRPELIETWGNRKKRCSLVKRERKDVQIELSSAAKAFSSKKAIEIDRLSSKNPDMATSISSFQRKYQKRAYYDAQFHLREPCDVRESKACMPKPTKATESMRRKQNDESITTYFELRCPNTPVELVTLYLG